MINYRQFKNSDPPHLARIWRGQPPQRGRAQPVSAAVIEELVLSKPYFDRQGLIVATDNGRHVGFVHAGFGPSDDLQALSPTKGAISALLVQADPREGEIADELLRRGEAYLAGSGARQIIAGGAGSLCPFYLGLYGGSALPGLLDSDAAGLEFFRRHDYQQVESIAVWHRELAGFRPLMDRVQIQIRRSTNLETIDDPPAENWWDACTLGCFNQVLTEVRPRGGGNAWASARFWDMGPLSATWGVHALGLHHIQVSKEHRRGGVATNLLGESLRLFHERGYALVEVQTSRDNLAIQGLLGRLGFVQIDSGAVLQKEVEPGST